MVKPTKMRNRQMYRAPHHVRSRQVGAALSADLRKKYGRRSVRVAVGDSVTIVRGEFATVEGKVSSVDTQKGAVAIEGIKKEQTRGEKYDVYIHASNLQVRSLDTGDKRRMARLGAKPDADGPEAAPAADSAGPGSGGPAGTAEEHTEPARAPDTGEPARAAEEPAVEPQKAPDTGEPAAEPERAAGAGEPAGTTGPGREDPAPEPAKAAEPAPEGREEEPAKTKTEKAAEEGDGR